MSNTKACELSIDSSILCISLVEPISSLIWSPVQLGDKHPYSLCLRCKYKWTLTSPECRFILEVNNLVSWAWVGSRGSGFTWGSSTLVLSSTFKIVPSRTFWWWKVSSCGYRVLESMSNDNEKRTKQQESKTLKREKRVKEQSTRIQRFLLAFNTNVHYCILSTIGSFLLLWIAGDIQ
jgi:hypothetical protein